MCSWIETSVALPAEGRAVTIGLRPQALQLSEGNSLKVDLVEQLGGVSYAYLTAETGERLVVEIKGDDDPKADSATSITFDSSTMLVFDAQTQQRLR